jgi:hypothetical protein
MDLIGNSDRFDPDRDVPSFDDRPRKAPPLERVMGDLEQATLHLTKRVHALAERLIPVREPSTQEKAAGDRDRAPVVGAPVVGAPVVALLQARALDLERLAEILARVDDELVV